MQGYLLGRPRPIAEYAKLLAAENPALPIGATSFASARARRALARTRWPLAS
jgi:hypothetical protein